MNDAFAEPVINVSISGKETMMASADDVLFNYVSRANPKSNDDLKRFLRRYLEHREEIIDFTATWRALSILDTVLPPAVIDPVEERRMLNHAKAHLRTLQRHRSSTRFAR